MKAKDKMKNVKSNNQIIYLPTTLITFFIKVFLSPWAYKSLSTLQAL